jgi:hypothetical protein
MRIMEQPSPGQDPVIMVQNEFESVFTRLLDPNMLAGLGMTPQQGAALKVAVKQTIATELAKMGVRKR